MRSKPRGSAASASSTTSLIALVSLLAATALAHAGSSHTNNAPLIRRQSSTLGCYSSGTPLTSIGTWKYQSASYCSGKCYDMQKPVAATSGGDECFCGDEIPASDDKTDESDCNAPCTGYGKQSCGGNGAWTVYLTGADNDVQTYGGSSSSSTSSTTSGSSTTSEAPTVITSQVPGGQTIIVTTTAVPEAANSSTNNNKSGGSNTAGIAAGVVVGVVALAAIIGGIFFWLRHKKRKEAEAAYQQQTSVAEFVRGAQPRMFAPSYSTSSDQRMDPEAGRRNSVGSLVDSEDYSRKILRVANPDSS